MAAAVDHDAVGDALSLRGVSRSFGGLQALRDLSIGIRQGEIFGLIGPNGSGKTTAINAVTGFYPPTSGSIHFDGRPIAGLRPHRVAGFGIARTFQNVALFKGLSVLENILLGRHVFMGASALKAMLYWGPARREEAENRRAVEEVIDLLQLEAVRDEPVETMPLGVQKRTELARALAAEPKLLILDEPMAGMNQEEKEYMVRFILDAKAAHGLSVLLIEHHMDVVSAICHRIAVLSNGEKIAEGAPREAMAEPAVIEAYVGRGHRE